MFFMVFTLDHLALLCSVFSTTPKSVAAIFRFSPLCQGNPACIKPLSQLLRRARA
jgi:hypothetical protein